MVKYTKRMSRLYKQNNQNRQYLITEAITLLKNNSTVNFIESIEIIIMLGIDPKKTEQNIRSHVVLPHGNGKIITLAVFAAGEDAIQAKKAGAEFIGMDDLANKIINNEIKKINIVIATPESMTIVSKLGPILGPKGLMPNPKLGTITNNVYNTVKQIKNGYINFRNDKNGIIHVNIGKLNFNNNDIKENILFLIKQINKNKPSNIKGNFIKKIYLSTTMGIAVDITIDCINNF
ncbi:50S ribosomal protein L1 [Enterobacteriaceae endosymbiont of Neohaemonia nigricornis]|uniref:50S ribosomal protein L1 n=1 Tax=Enterobacteriaceae endosymbiont of Neohaemonia nigricornis TaxID=2675792 RepID=UPI00144943C2|nr:50S ribosomal protein L1 [Enterobacteriaceae endosymbiont of Neohaemonia nigricornis]QJC30507.1 50S ribosomal protein L1 [Enterobacteriaceae endosymbiont of Neohaemonia nigricornis]